MDDPTQRIDDGATDITSTVTALTTTYKVLGDLANADASAVLGRNTAASGTPAGVTGTVDAPGGYGLYTPDDAKVNGVLEITDVDTTGDGFSLEAGTTSTQDAANVVMGHASNAAKDGAEGVTIGGGGFDSGTTTSPNVVSGHYGTVGGGEGNAARNNYATIAGGRDNTSSAGNTTVGGGLENTASDSEATVGGGYQNTASGSYTTVGGGFGNTASGYRATVGGGYNNTASGVESTVPGGSENTASGNYSQAAGRKAATSGNDGAIVFGDSSSSSIYAQGADEARFQHDLYANSLNNTSARSKKTAIEPTDADEVLAGVRSLGVSTWTFLDRDDDNRHMGPMAGDFHETFGLGDDDGHISTVDADGVALAAIQGLAERLEQKDDRITALEDETRDLRTKSSNLREENDDLRDCLATLEDRVSAMETGDIGESAPADD